MCGIVVGRVLSDVAGGSVVPMERCGRTSFSVDPGAELNRSRTYRHTSSAGGNLSVPKRQSRHSNDRTETDQRNEVGASDRMTTGRSHFHHSVIVSSCRQSHRLIGQHQNNHYPLTMPSASPIIAVVAGITSRSVSIGQNGCCCR